MKKTLKLFSIILFTILLLFTACYKNADKDIERKKTQDSIETEKTFNKILSAFFK